MKRRKFVKVVGAAGAGSSLLAVPASADPLVSTTDDLNLRPEPPSPLVAHCKRILEQNLLREGEIFVVATPMVFDHDYLLALLTAAGEIGASGAHMAVFPRINSAGQYESSLSAWHWNTYAEADLLITSNLGNDIGLPGASTAYGNKVGNHPYRTDFEAINRPGHKTRWLALGYDIPRQQRYFPTAERRERTLRGAQLLDETRGELRVVSDAGSDWRCSMEGRPGHAQYGIADMAGRWDNFGYGCVACGPIEDSAEGVLVLQPGDIIPDLHPQVLEETVTLNWEGGYVTSVEGGRRAQELGMLLSVYNDREAFGISHFGWGTHERTELGEPGDVGHFHHNKEGSLLYSLGMNFGHGLGGAGAGYSGLGYSSRIAPNHTHFTMFGCDVYVAGDRVIESGRVSPEAGGRM